MKKIHILGLALFAVFALSSIAASAAFAEDEFLFNGEAIGGTEEGLPAETSGELLIEDMGSKIDLLCSGIFDGYVGPGGHTLITKILNLLKEEELLPGTTIPSIHCDDHSVGVKCLSTTELIEVDVLRLPWLDLITLGAGGQFLDTLSSGGGGNPAYEVECVVLGVAVKVTCEGTPTAVLTNEGTGVLGVFEEGETFNLKGTCSDGGEGLVVGEGTTKDTSAGTLSVS